MTFVYAISRRMYTDTAAVHKRRRIFFGHFYYPPPQCENFDTDLPIFYLLISSNIGISDPPKIFRRLLWTSPSQHDKQEL